MDGVTLGGSNQKEIDVAAAATTNLGGVTNARVRITGAATITSFGSTPHRLRFLRFAGACTLVHSASLSLPLGLNMKTQAGDTAVAMSDAAGAWTVYAVGWQDVSNLDFRDRTDTTKRVTFDASGISTGTTRIYTLPNKAGTLAMLSDITAFPLGLDEQDAPRVVEQGGAAYVDVPDIWRWPFLSQAGALTLTASHNHRAFLITGTVAVTLPAASACDDDWSMLLKARGGTITLMAAGSDTVDGAASVSITTGNRAMVLRTSATTFEVF